MKTRDQLQRGLRTLEGTARAVGLGLVLNLAGDLLQSLQSLVVALLYRGENLRESAVVEIRTRAQLLVQSGPVQTVLELPDQIQNLVRDLQELSKLLLQLLINATPLYSLIQQPSEQEVEDFLNQHDFTSNSSSRRSSANANSLFLKAMDGRPRRRRSLYSLAARGTQSPEPTRQSEEQEVPPPAIEVPATRRPSATDLLMAPLRQFVSQSQKAFEYLSPNGEEGGEGEK
uniref:Perilipin 6 n=1 Tax=Knipowitschia caucasica TaxID=637954 RepID=A0AAV2MEP7_KNICA